MATGNQKVIATAGIISVGVGSANAVLKHKRLPSYKFLVGSAIAYLLLSAMGNTEAMGEVAKGLALGVMTTVVLGEGGGVLSYIAGDGEMDTATERRILTDSEPTRREARMIQRLVPNPQGGFRSDFLPALPGVPPTHNR